MHCKCSSQPPLQYVCSVPLPRGIAPHLCQSYNKQSTFHQLHCISHRFKSSSARRQSLRLPSLALPFFSTPPSLIASSQSSASHEKPLVESPSLTLPLLSPSSQPTHHAFPLLLLLLLPVPPRLRPSLSSGPVTTHNPIINHSLASQVPLPPLHHHHGTHHHPDSVQPHAKAVRLPTQDELLRRCGLLRARTRLLGAPRNQLRLLRASQLDVGPVPRLSTGSLLLLHAPQLRRRSG